MTIRISVVVPTYREVENIPTLVERIDAALSQDDYEIIIADDFSDDGTDKVCEQLAERLPVRLLSRRQNRGLSPAVIDGISAAAGEFVVVMDADLSHPPDKIPELIKSLQAGAQFVVGSRYVDGGKTDDSWPWWRRLNSWGATVLARPLAPLADPMSGFFALPRAQMPPPRALSPIGYKIGLEIVVKANCPPNSVVEVPIFFGDRQYGKSKMTMREQINYLRHLRRLYHYKWSKIMEVFQFGIVGGLGFLLDVLFYYLLQALGMPHLLARGVAFCPAVTSNWFLNRIMTFKDRPRISAAKQWSQFVAVSLMGFVFNWGTYATLTINSEFFIKYKFIAFVAGVIVGAVFNFLISDKIVFPNHNHRARR